MGKELPLSFSLLSFNIHFVLFVTAMTSINKLRATFGCLESLTHLSCLVTPCHKVQEQEFGVWHGNDRDTILPIEIISKLLF